MKRHDAAELKLNRLKALIENDFGARWTASTLAAAVGLSVADVRSGFPRMFGRTALYHLRDVRLREAADRLVAGKTVSETAEACGFTTCGNLSRMFHKNTGIFPSHYRFKIAGWKYAGIDQPSQR